MPKTREGSPIQALAKKGVELARGEGKKSGKAGNIVEGEKKAERPGGGASPGSAVLSGGKSGGESKGWRWLPAKAGG